nr:AAA family ATPase [uncultured Capnocytophaga sp.]
MKSNIKVVTEGFRAIGHAAIQISGITVVAGENSSGKSTISKLLYELFNTVANYEVLVKEELIREFNDLFQFFKIVSTDLKEFDYFNIRQLSYEGVYNDLSLKEIEDTLLSFLNKIYQNDIQKSNRYNTIVDSILGEKITDHNNDLTRLESFIKNKIREAEERVKARSINLFTQELSKEFRSNVLPDIFEVSEEEEVIVALNKPSLSFPFSIKKAIYIDTPMSLSVWKDNNNKYWSTLNRLLLRVEKNASYPSSISLLISDNIKGEADTSGLLNNELSFYREDGEVFDLAEVATGIKAFSIIQLLLKNGHIDNRTLLIIDEPESHLHPQWIVEYARMIVLLHKHIGVKFFLASHNPDMVSAIRYIAEKEEVLDNVNYYLAEKEEGEMYQYNYTPLGSDISPIFKSFNIAIDRISQYSVDSDNEDDNL